MKKCYCGAPLSTRRGYCWTDENLGTICIPDAEYQHCDQCGEDFVSGDVADRMIDAEQKKIAELLYARLKSFAEFDRKFMPVRELQVLLGVKSRQAVHQNKRISRLIYSVLIAGERFYYRKSAERYAETGDGRLKLAEEPGIMSRFKFDKELSFITQEIREG